MDFIKKIVLVGMMLTMYIMVQAQDTKTIIRAFENSYIHEADTNYIQAIQELKNIYDPASYHINARLGYLSYLSGMLTESVAYYQKAIELKPYAIEARFGLTYPASAMGNWAQVKDQYIKILEVDPQNTKANYYLGLMEYNAASYELAAKHFEKVVNFYPFDLESILMYAWTNYQMGKTREAKVLFNEALIVQPGNESALEGLELIK